MIIKYFFMYYIMFYSDKIDKYNKLDKYIMKYGKNYKPP